MSLNRGYLLHTLSVLGRKRNRGKAEEATFAIAKAISDDRPLPKAALETFRDSVLRYVRRAPVVEFDPRLEHVHAKDLHIGHQPDGEKRSPDTEMLVQTLNEMTFFLEKHAAGAPGVRECPICQGWFVRATRGKEQLYCTRSCRNRANYVAQRA